MSETRVYIDGGTEAHLLAWNDSPNNSAAEALCGQTAWPGYWFGTGTQTEHERALDLKLCTRCTTIRGRRAGGTLTR